MPNFEKLRALMSLGIILYQFQKLQVLFNASHDDFGCLKAGLQQFF